MKKVGIYVNGNNIRGMGHIHRSLELADTLRSKTDIYFDRYQTEQSVFGETTHRLIPVSGLGDLLQRLKASGDYDIFINDVLSTSVDYMIALHKSLPNAKLVNFEDEGEGIYQADLVFNALYSQGNIPHVKAGERYYIIPKGFLEYSPIRIKNRVQHVLLTFGGADPQKYSERLFNIIIRSPEKYGQYKFHMVVGRAKQDADALLMRNKEQNISILYDVDNMPEVMSQCDVAVASRGRTGYELAFMGIPAITLAQNVREERHRFMCNENGFCYLGLNPDDAVIESGLDMLLHLSSDRRQKMQSLMLENDLRNGRERIIEMLRKL